MLEVSNLATATVVALSPYFSIGVGQFAKEFGKDMYTEVKKMKDWLWNKINSSRDKDLQQTTNLFESQPEVFGEAMEKMLVPFLTSNPAIAQELSQKLQSFDQSNKYQINIQGGTTYGVVQGDNAHITQNITS